MTTYIQMMGSGFRAEGLGFRFQILGLYGDEMEHKIETTIVL